MLGSWLATRTTEELEGLRVLAHPLRLRLLSLLTGTARSASEAARELGDSQANISYHLRRLEAAGLVVVAEEVMIRGGRSKRYRHEADQPRGALGSGPGGLPDADDRHRRGAAAARCASPIGNGRRLH